MDKTLEDIVICCKVFSLQSDNLEIWINKKLLNLRLVCFFTLFQNCGELGLLNTFARCAMYSKHGTTWEALPHVLLL